jgi:hypothetical protein
MFGKLKEINLEKSSSWEGNNFLTFDIDWCSDEVLSYTLDIIDRNNIKATFFITHETKLLERMRENKNIELGIHPNFNFLLNGDFRYGKNIKEIIQYYIKLVPDAISVRSHSLTQNTNIINMFCELNLLNHSNTHIPYSSNINIKPYKLWNNMLEIPFFWEDDIHCLYDWDFNISDTFNTNGLKVYNFHPIHIFLNTNTLNIYENARENFHNYEKLKSYKNNLKYGVENYLIDLINKGIDG